jgi:hypothetical protein
MRVPRTKDECGKGELEAQSILCELEEIFGSKILWIGSRLFQLGEGVRADGCGTRRGWALYSNGRPRTRTRGRPK